MKITFNFDEDEYETARNMMDWSEYATTCGKIREYCQYILSNNATLEPNLKYAMIDILGMIHPAIGEELKVMDSH